MMFRALLITAVCGFSSWGVAAAQMPSQAEMRQQMEAVGMTPAQIDKALEAVAGFTPPAAMVSQLPATEVCVDENENDICDAEEDDPRITQCRRTYLNVIEKKARETYGDRLGKSAMRISQTCLTAAAGGTLEATESGARQANMEQMLEVSGYWNDVLGYARYLVPSETELDLDFENMDDEKFDKTIARFPRDLQALTRPGEGEDDFYNTAQPIHARCEAIRNDVGQSYRQSVHDNTICLTVTPEPVENMDEASK